MDNDNDTPLEETENLRRGPAPPEALESHVVTALRRERLIREGSGISSPMKIAASLILFVAGALVGHYAIPDRVAKPPASVQSRYLLLLAGDDTPAPDGSTRAAEYGEWARRIGARGTSISGAELVDHAELVSSRESASFPDLASVGGYFLIEASDDASAVALARTCPHLKYGGSIVVRRIR